jgi:hypothetical protein
MTPAFLEALAEQRTPAAVDELCRIRAYGLPLSDEEQAAALRRKRDLERRAGR